MEKWILAQNLEHFRRCLSAEADAASRRTLRAMISQAERELTMMEATANGARSGPRLVAGSRDRFEANARQISMFKKDFETSQQLYLLLDPRPGLHIVEANPAYTAATMIDPERVAGNRIFDVFPDNPDDPFADGVSSLLKSLRIAAETGLRHRMKIQRYDIRNDSGVFVQRFWRPRNLALLNDDGHLLYLVHHVEDVTEEVQARRHRDAGICRSFLVNSEQPPSL